MEIKIKTPKTEINFYKVGYGFGIINPSTDDFQEFCLELQAETGITLSGSSPERSEGGPAWLIWEGFHKGRNEAYNG
tara:strand:+ start:250 stop:480 length:231 start_codon:yes stop_codon:yes gene_type:complete